MTFSLYDATVPTFQQILGSVSGLIDKAEAWCGEHKAAPEELIQARLAPDMYPFSYQVKSTAVHSLGAIEGVRKGAFSPDTAEPPATFEALRQRIAETRAALDKITREEVNAFLGRDMRFEHPRLKMAFSAEDFLRSFSLPNFYFHATTAYDILRMKGVKIGKGDFLGKLPLKA